MAEITTIAQRMRKLIGTQFNFMKQSWVLIEVLEDEDKLILASKDSFAPIQADQYGQATRRSPETITVQMSESDGLSYTEEMLMLLSGKC